MEIIGEALEKAGSNLREVVRIRMYITDPKNSERVSDAFREVFGDICPAATMVICKLLEDDWLVEMEVDAIIGSAE